MGRIGDYELLNEIARAARESCIARAHEMKREVALKMISLSSWLPNRK